MLDIIKRIGVGAVVLALAVPISMPFILAAKLENNSRVAVLGLCGLLLCLTYALGRWITRED